MKISYFFVFYVFISVYKTFEFNLKPKYCGAVYYSETLIITF